MPGGAAKRPRIFVVYFALEQASAPQIELGWRTTRILAARSMASRKVAGKLARAASTSAWPSRSCTRKSDTPLAFLASRSARAASATALRRAFSA